jgi:hypothetical protein
MSAQSPPRVTTRQNGTFVRPEVSSPGTRRQLARYAAAGLRLSIGRVFLWAFADKAFALGHDTAGKDAWIHVGSPTEGLGLGRVWERVPVVMRNGWLR